MNKNFIIRDREAGNVIDSFNTLEEAQRELSIYEENDREEGIYKDDFYEIVLNPEVLTQIANHFVELYSDEIESVTPDMISEWWGMTCDQYGCSQENKGEVLSQIENEILTHI